jgi:2-phosphoglycerate kinase
MAPDERDRLIKLEIETSHLTKKVDEMAKQIDEMHDLLMQAKGARLILIGVASVVGFASAKLASWSGVIGGFPR